MKNKNKKKTMINTSAKYRIIMGKEILINQWEYIYTIRW